MNCSPNDESVAFSRAGPKEVHKVTYSPESRNLSPESLDCESDGGSVLVSEENESTQATVLSDSKKSIQHLSQNLTSSNHCKSNFNGDTEDQKVREVVRTSSEGPFEENLVAKNLLAETCNTNGDIFKSCDYDLYQDIEVSFLQVSCNAIKK